MTDQQDITQKIDSASVDDNYGPSECDVYTAGIDLDGHMNGIEVYGNSPSEASALRDEIMKRLEENKRLSAELQRYHAALCDVVKYGTGYAVGIAKQALEEK